MSPLAGLRHLRTLSLARPHFCHPLLPSRMLPTFRSPHLQSNDFPKPASILTDHTILEAGQPLTIRQKLRPDIMVVEATNAEVTSTCGKRKSRNANGQPNSSIAARHNGKHKRKVKIVEVGYTSEGRFVDKCEEKNAQHCQLKQLLEAQGFQVDIVPLIIGSTGGIFNLTSAGLDCLGIDKQRRQVLVQKLHVKSIVWMHDIIKKRRALDATLSPNLPCNKKPPDR